jgi:hypothetical protein
VNAFISAALRLLHTGSYTEHRACAAGDGVVIHWFNIFSWATVSFGQKTRMRSFGGGRLHGGRGGGGGGGAARVPTRPACPCRLPALPPSIRGRWPPGELEARGWSVWAGVAAGGGGLGPFGLPSRRWPRPVLPLSRTLLPANDRTVTSRGATKIFFLLSSVITSVAPTEVGLFAEARCKHARTGWTQADWTTW